MHTGVPSCRHRRGRGEDSHRWAPHSPAVIQEAGQRQGPQGRCPPEGQSPRRPGKHRLPGPGYQEKQDPGQAAPQAVRQQHQSRFSQEGSDHRRDHQAPQGHGGQTVLLPQPKSQAQKQCHSGPQQPLLSAPHKPVAQGGSHCPRDPPPAGTDQGQDGPHRHRPPPRTQAAQQQCPAAIERPLRQIFQPGLHSPGIQPPLASAQIPRYRHLYTPFPFAAAMIPRPRRPFRRMMPLALENSSMYNTENGPDAAPFPSRPREASKAFP